MAEARKKRERFVTPAGRLKYPRIIGVPDEYKGKKTWNTKFIVDAHAAQAIILSVQKYMPAAQELLDEKLAAEKAKNKRKDYGINDEPWLELEDGTYEFNFKMNYEVKDTKSATGTRIQRPAVFDAGLQPVPETTRIGGGTTAKIAYTLSPYFVDATKKAGVTLYLEAVQIIQLVEFGQRDASSFGFGEEDGFRAEDEDSNPFTVQAPAAVEEDEEDEEDEDGEGADF
jgi:hypothetical protein